MSTEMKAHGALANEFGRGQSHRFASRLRLASHAFKMSCAVMPEPSRIQGMPLDGPATLVAKTSFCRSTRLDASKPVANEWFLWHQKFLLCAQERHTFQRCPIKLMLSCRQHELIQHRMGDWLRHLLTKGHGP